MGFAEKEQQGLKGPAVPALLGQPPYSQHRGMAVLEVPGLFRMATSWWSKPQGSLERQEAGCSQALLQGGSQSFPMVKCRGGSPGDDPSWFTRNLALAATARSSCSSPNSPTVFQYVFCLLIYTQHEPFQAESRLKGQDRPFYLSFVTR